MFQRFLRRQQPKSPRILSYNQPESGQPVEIIQPVIEWFCASLMQAGYFKQAHLFWLTQVRPSDFEQAVLRSLRKNEPVFLYRCDDSRPDAPSGYYWRLMPEHPSLRIYQLEPTSEE